MTRAADLVVLNGRIITVDAGFRTTSAFAVEGERFVAVGTDAEMRSRIGPRTEVLDVRGAPVMPGLIDGHAHMDREGLKGVFPSLAGARSIAEIKTRIREIARATPPGEWIVTLPVGDPPYYFDVPECLAEKRFPTRHDLDEAAPDHPVYIRPIWGYWRHTLPLVSIANSRALALAGVTRDTPAPDESITIERDGHGEPTGVFTERTLMSIAELTLMRAAPGFTHATRVRALPAAMRAYHAFGTTSVYEEHGAAGELIRAYKAVHAQGAMTMRTTLAFSPNWRAAGDADPDALIEAWAGFLAEPGSGDARLKLSGIVIDLRASGQDRLRASASPYTGWAGFNYDFGLPRDKAKAVAKACARWGVRGVGIWPEMLNLFEEVDREIPLAGRRWILGHISTLSPSDIERIRRLGLAVTTHTNRYVYKEGHLLEERLGPARVNEIAPIRSLTDAGVPVSLATDNVPVSLWHPVWQSVARENRYTGKPVAPDEALTREQAVRSATIHGAWLTGDEREKGSIEPGKLADFAVLTDDPLTVETERLKDIAAVSTWVGGRCVHGDDAAR